MKKYITKIMVIIILIICFLTMFLSYYILDQKPRIKNADKITKIMVYTQPVYRSKTTENKLDIMKIVNYVNELELKKTAVVVEQYMGGAYVITVYYDHQFIWIDYQTSKKYYFFDEFVKKSGKEWYEITYEQSQEIEMIFENMGNK